MNRLEALDSLSVKIRKIDDSLREAIEHIPLTRWERAGGFVHGGCYFVFGCRYLVECGAALRNEGGKMSLVISKPGERPEFIIEDQEYLAGLWVRILGGERIRAIAWQREAAKKIEQLLAEARP